jgi:hypothetical protein
MRILGPLALLLAFLPDPLAAQATPSAATAEAWHVAVDAAFRAYDRGNWRELARIVHPSALARFREGVLEVQRDLAEMPKVYGARGLIPRAKRRQEYEAWAALPADSVLVRTARDRIDRVYARPELKPTVTRQILGHAVEGDTLVHVVFRYTARWVWPKAERPLEEARVDVLTLRRASDGWRPTLNGGLTVPLFPPATIITTEL